METTNVEHIRELNADERNRAKEKARIMVAGKQPTKKTIQVTSKYPEYITLTIRIFCWVVLIAAFIPSGMRIFDSGANAFKHGLMAPDAVAGLVGICSIFLAEIGQVVSTMALSLVQSRTSRWILWASAFIFTVWALVANFVAAKPDTAGTFMQAPFIYLEAIVPTIMVISMSYILKEVDLHRIELQHKENVEFKDAEVKWQNIKDTAESQSSWLRHYAESLKEEIRKVNKTKKAKEVFEAGLTDDQWKFLIKREIEADNWFNELLTEKPKQEKTEERHIEPFEKDGIVIGYLELMPDKTWKFVCHSHGDFGVYGTKAGALIAANKHCNHQVHNQLEG